MKWLYLSQGQKSTSKRVLYKFVLFIYISLFDILQPNLGICLLNTDRAPVYFTKKALRIITGVHPRSPSEPLFRQLKFLNCENIFKYLVGRLMYRVYHGELSTLQFLFVKNSDIHMHDTRQSGYYHIPVCRTNLGKSSLRYFGAWLWNKILSADINQNVSDNIFSGNLKTAIYKIYFRRNSTKLYVAYYWRNVLLLLHPLHPCTPVVINDI